jgi:hypothetical protein
MSRLRTFLCLVAVMASLTSCALTFSAGSVTRARPAHPSIRPDWTIGVPGYYTYSGPHGKPIQFGAPFMQPCKPIVVLFENSVPNAPYQSFVDVVHEARAAGVNIRIAQRNRKLFPSDLDPPGQPFTPVQTAEVFADQKAPIRLRSGGLQHFMLGYDAVLTGDGQHEYVSNPNILLHLSALGGDPTSFRKAALGFVGFTQGIAVSTVPGSAFTPDFASGADRFSAQDIRAMLTMSGCAAKAPATGAQTFPPV